MVWASKVWFQSLISQPLCDNFRSLLLPLPQQGTLLQLFHEIYILKIYPELGHLPPFLSLKLDPNHYYFFPGLKQQIPMGLPCSCSAPPTFYSQTCSQSDSHKTESVHVLALFKTIQPKALFQGLAMAHDAFRAWPLDILVCLRLTEGTTALPPPARHTAPHISSWPTPFLLSGLGPNVTFSMKTFPINWRNSPTPKHSHLQNIQLLSGYLLVYGHPSHPMRT